MPGNCRYEECRSKTQSLSSFEQQLKQGRKIARSLKKTVELVSECRADFLTNNSDQIEPKVMGKGRQFRIRSLHRKRFSLRPFCRDKPSTSADANYRWR